MTAAEQLTDALLVMAARGERPRCGDGETSAYWTSENRAELAQAASWCAGCPVLPECGAAADELKATAGVWAGVERFLSGGRR
ncbi:WhiB family transcriptional regulator [Flexivirga alba]|uniref:WhiB family transcriptional regulator n=1 Tax=Flexivirga alba TaxID=702742 RepID=A0ABW2AL53_9MICO